jgi:hypothetical protein
MFVVVGLISRMDGRMGFVPSLNCANRHTFVPLTGYIVGPYANMQDANLTNTDMSNTTLTGANLGSATFTNMRTGGLLTTASALPALPTGYKYVTTTASGGYIVGPDLNLTGANLCWGDGRSGICEGVRGVVGRVMRRRLAVVLQLFGLVSRGF